MSSLVLVYRGVATITSADGAGPKTVTLPGAVRLQTAFVTCSHREKRYPGETVQRGDVVLTTDDTSPKEIALATTAPITRSHVVAQTFHNASEYAPYGHGAIVQLKADGSAVQISFPKAAMTEDEEITVHYEVVTENLESRGVTARLTAVNTLEIHYGAALAAGEELVVAYEVYDLDDVVDKMNEQLYRLTRVLGLLGENALKDLISRDDAGNEVSWRLRVFDTKAHAEAATVDLPDGESLETGELCRVLQTREIIVDVNDETSVLMTRTDLAATPDPEA